MNQAFTFGIRDGKHVVITTPEVPFSQQRRDFKRVAADKLGDEPEKFDAVEIWTSSGGRVKRRKHKGDNHDEPTVVADLETDDGPDESVTPQPEATKPVTPVVPQPANTATVATAKSVPWGKPVSKPGKPAAGKAAK